MHVTPILQVAIPVPFRKLFEYLPNGEESSFDNLIGVRVKVSFGRSYKIGIVVGIANNASYPIEKLKPVSDYLDRTPYFSDDDMHWLKWVSQYYLHPPGDTFFTALPAVLRKEKMPPSTIIVSWQLSKLGHQTDIQTLSRTPKQKLIFEWFRTRNKNATQSDISDHFVNWKPSVKSLQEKGLIESIEVSKPNRSINQTVDLSSSGPSLNIEQQTAVDKIVGGVKSFNVYLLDGITGSGKTEVYLNAISSIIQMGQQVLFLLPEIGLTPQLMNRFQTRYGDLVAATHSGLTDNERFSIWNDVRLGNIKVLIGTRSAIFTPFDQLGMIIIDEEHDLSFKQQDGLRYSARDIAISRASQLDVPIILGSATPSLESLSNLNKKTYHHLTLRKRAGNAVAPTISTIDIRHQKLEHHMSPAIINKITATLERKEQVLLFLNRRGFSPVMMCQECGWSATCHRCDTHMTLHQHRQRITCHHCGADKKTPEQCPSCSSIDLRPIGFGTERIENILQDLFPHTDIIRIDRDTTTRKNAIRDLLAKIEPDKGQILLGTQMLAKGHDFPNVTFVGILDADQGLFGADIRSAERMAQLITQVAGRAGRGNKPGSVAIQTLHPEHPLLQTLLTKGYSGFSESALHERKATQLPPFTFAAMIRTESVQLGNNFQFLNDLKNILNRHNNGVELLGPAPSPMERKAGKFRTQLLLLCTTRNPLHTMLRASLPEIEKLKSAKKVRWSLDIDPLEMS